MIEFIILSTIIFLAVMARKKQIVVEDSFDDFPETLETSNVIRVRIEDPNTVDTKWETEIFFNKGDPTNWDEYKGQERVKEFIQLHLDVLEQGEGLKMIFIAPKGAGKTSIFRITGNKLIEKRPSRYIELTPAMINSKSKLDDLMAQLQQDDILCIDEIHMLSRKFADTLLPAIEDNIYPFEDGMRRLPKGISWLGATTDVGLLPEAFRDRFQLLSLEALSKRLLSDILKCQPYPIADMAADIIAMRSVGSPRELKRLYRVARDVARRRISPIIMKYDIMEAFRLLDLDANGLYSQDRRVLEGLYNNPKYYALKKDGTRPKRYAHSERAIRAITGIDEHLYRDEIEPKLLQLGFLTIGTAGRELTDKFFKVYKP